MTARRILGAAVVAILLVPVAAFAANPFLGKWAIESFGQKEDLVFTFSTDTEMVIAVGEESTPPQSYVLDQGTGQLTLPVSDGSTIVLRYLWQGGDVFILFMTEALLDQMVAAFTASLPQDANALTNEIVGELREAVREVFVTNPFMRGTRLE